MGFERISHATNADMMRSWSYIAVDAHVHLHDGETSLSAAANNIARTCPDADAGALMLVEREGEGIFASLQGDGARGVHPTSEPIALLRDAGTVPLLIIAGRQVVAAEGVELLLLGTLARPRDGTPLDVLLAEQAPPAIAVLPWGFGKWLGRRGAIVRDALSHHPRLLPGDIQARPGALPSPTLRRSAGAGVPVLAGTDPLAMESDHGRIGSFGQLVRATIDPDAPATSVLDALLTSGGQRYGERHSLTAAARQQWAWHHRRARAT